MLRTLPQTRDAAWPVRLASIVAFVVLLALSARAEIPLVPVPFTLQVLVVLLAGMVLGARDGATAVASYVGLIAVGMPIDANMLGAAALVGPTAGFLIGFIPAAFVVGWMVQVGGATRAWQRWLAGVAGIAVIYAVGLPVLMVVTGMDLSAAWAAVVVPFLGLDMVKAAVAAVMAESGRAALLRWMPANQS